MIEVENLTKRYAGVEALKNISFHVGKGEIVGFLGPNGAGKSTTMRILSCFLPATSGTARIAGFDVFHDSKKARERIGYMPENVPLYSEMRVSEYLSYRAALKGVKGRRRQERVEDVKVLCSLKDVENKLIGSLSKGYRQRVGLADAMVHEPDLLILDEPTIGLDPHQIRQVRELIRNLGRHHTILLSSHILSEVEMTCSRVIIINKGQIEASDTPQNLRAKLHSGNRILFEAQPHSPASAEQALKKIKGVQDITYTQSEDDWSRFVITFDGVSDPREEIFQLAVQQKWSVRELSRRHASLEDIFTEIIQSEDTPFMTSSPPSASNQPSR